jgi:hypothetical protein
VSLKGPAHVHKSRENTNGTFSIGKTWDLKELTALEVSGVCIQAVSPRLSLMVSHRELQGSTSLLHVDIDGKRTIGRIKKHSCSRRFASIEGLWADRRHKYQAGGCLKVLEVCILPYYSGCRIRLRDEPPLEMLRPTRFLDSTYITARRDSDISAVSRASRSSAATSAAGEDGRSNRSATPPPMPKEQRRLQVSTNSTGYSESPPRSSSPSVLTTRQMASGVRSASPTGRSNTLRAPTPGTSGVDQPTTANGRPLGLPNGVRRRSPSPGPSPGSAYLNAASPPNERAYPLRSPLGRGDPVGPPQREVPAQEPSRSGRRPAELERPSFEREGGRENGLPSTPRRAPSAARTARTASPPPESRYPSARSDRAPSPQPPPDPTPYRNGILANSRQPRANSRSDRAPSPNITPLDLTPQRRDRDRVPSPNPPSEASFRRPRAGSRSDRAPSPNPPSDVSSRRQKIVGRPDRGPSPALLPLEPPQQRSRAGSRSDREAPSDNPNIPKRRDAAPSVTKQDTPSRTGQGPSRRQAELADPRERPPLPVVLNQGVRKDPYARISYYDTANQATADRLLAVADKATGEEESNEATMANIEEMLEGYEWSSVGSRSIWGEPKGAADQIEARLLKELSALDAVRLLSEIILQLTRFRPICTLSWRQTIV